MERHLGSVDKVKVAQKRKGCFQEWLGCEALTEFDFYKGSEKEKFAHAKEDSSFCCRLCCAPNHSFKMTVTEEGTKEEILSVDRPFVCCAVLPCCCFRKMTMSSGGKEIGNVEEKCYCCVPRFEINDAEGKAIYQMHQPTCVGGMCVNCCAEGNPCFGRGCCKAPFHVFPADMEDTDNGAEPSGKILKVMKSAAAEIFTDADVFEVDFPKDATTEQKGLVMGSAIFLNAIFFEAKGDEAS